VKIDTLSDFIFSGFFGSKCLGRKKSKKKYFVLDDLHGSKQTI